MNSDFPNRGYIVRFSDKAAALLTLVHIREYLASPDGQSQPEQHTIRIWSPPLDSPTAELYMSLSAYVLCESLGLDCKDIIEVPLDSLPKDRVPTLGQSDQAQPAA